MKTKLLAVLMVFAMSLTAAIAAETWYVSSGRGDDAVGTGSVDAPFASFVKAYEAASDGDRIVITDRCGLGRMITIAKVLTVSGDGYPDAALDGECKGYKIYIHTEAHFDNLAITGLTGDNGVEFLGNLKVPFSASNVVFRANNVSGTYTIRLRETPGHFYNCVFTNNFGGVKFGDDAGSGALLENCLFYDNEGPIISLCGGTVKNCTIVGNRDDKERAFCVWQRCAVYNSIIMSNTVNGVEDNWQCSTSTANWHNNCIRNASTISGSGNFDEDPLFVPGTIMLSSSSPCKFAGNPDYASTHDIFGRRRSYTSPSVGCVEYYAGDDPNDATFQGMMTGPKEEEYGYLTFVATVSGVYTGELSYEWSLCDGDGAEIEPASVGTISPNGAVFTITQRGLYSDISCCVRDEGGQELFFKCEFDLYTLYAARTGTPYVSCDIDPTMSQKPYSSIEIAASTIKDAIAESQPGDTIVLLDGTHHINEELTISGRTIRSHGGRDRCSVMQNMPKALVFFLANDSETLKGATVDGITFTNMTAGVGWGSIFNVKGDNNKILNCRFSNCGNSSAGMITFEGTQIGAMVKGCIFTDNTNDGDGIGAIITAQTAKSLTIEDCLFARNRSCQVIHATDWRFAGGVINIQQDGTDCVIRNCTIVSNSWKYGSAITTLGTTLPIVENTIIADNYYITTDEEGETVYQPRNDYKYYNGISNAKASLENDTGVCIGADKVVNCCFWPWTYGEGDFALSDLTIAGTSVKSISTPLIFRGAQRGDYRLRTTSPCVDAGTPQSRELTDLDVAGNRRVRFGTVDIGAYECQTTPRTILTLQ